MTYFAPSKLGLLVVVCVEEQVLRAGLARRRRRRGRAAIVTCSSALAARQVDDVERHARRSRRARSRGASPRPPARVGRVSAWYFGRGVPGRERLLDELVDDAAVLGVHASRARPFVAGLPQRAEERRVVDHEARPGRP